MRFEALSGLDVSKRSNRALIRKIALRLGVWQILPLCGRIYFELTLHPVIKKWWGRIRWPLALKQLSKVVKMLVIAWRFINSCYFRRCYAIAQAYVNEAIAKFESIKESVNSDFREAYLKYLRSVMMDANAILFIGTMLNDRRIFIFSLNIVDAKACDEK